MEYNFVDIIRIPWNIRIVHIVSYLARNVCHVIHSFVLVVDIICIGNIVRYLERNIRTFFHAYSYSVSDWCIASFPVGKYYFCLVCLVSEY